MSDLILKENQSLNLNNQETYSPELSFMVLLNPLRSYKVLDSTVWSSVAMYSFHLMVTFDPVWILMVP